MAFTQEDKDIIISGLTCCYSVNGAKVRKQLQRGLQCTEELNKLKALYLFIEAIESYEVRESGEEACCITEEDIILIVEKAAKLCDKCVPNRGINTNNYLLQEDEFNILLEH